MSKATMATVRMALALTACVPTASAQSSPAANVPKMEEVYKNIQVLNGMPAEQMLTTMRFMRASLGVACTFCHLEPNQAAGKQAPNTAKSQAAARVQPGWWLDEPAREFDTPKKQIARMMIKMTAALNKESFGGSNQITCFTCHRGSLRPPSNFDATLVSEASGTAASAENISGVTADGLVDKFIAAIGGPSAVQRISSRAIKGNVQYGNLIAERAAGRVQPPFPVEIYAKTPAMRVVVTQEGNGVIRGFSGTKGWQQGRTSTDARHQPRDMREAELGTVKLEDPYFFAGQLKQLVTGLRVARIEKLDGKDAYVVIGRTQILPEVQLYFDRESGMLVRLVSFTQGLLGRLPTRIDYSDFRTVDGVKVPFRWVNTDIAEALSFTYQADQVQQNTAVDESKFVKPAKYLYLDGPERR